MPRALAILALSGLALAGAPQAQAGDGIFGSFFSRGQAAEAPKPVAVSETRDRDREARNLRREYWERERARLSQAGMAREASNQSVAVR
jgi:hypothetical protein